ncbi:Bug family tripartite tricarboxylate transporter substrate binding protein [Roseomonas marmotae]|uniref:Tripartite tricarboxylate transporter substrate binding protein n=1 Tax=Roseomonas marmotae TaxID=2768161 RepID=A0ABS3KAZ4_9PROT|nr:tripartite tricarboxylate transporter substrate binding protein [Roseomonas marmotae]MBO1074610.1 tripartite tricarboxylate transporter substrate binding protein [Roseomonas marmotae]QTI81634.1 tripartite tricarboxylate transporter substrate binding protein [Roseomonas marmotae]
MTNACPPRRAALAAGLAALLPWRGAFAQQQPFPDHALKWIVAYAAGGGTDTLARMIAASLSPRLGQPVVVDNRPGAATNIGAEAAAKSPPDGYTLFSADNGTLVFNPALFRDLPYDPQRDFRPVGLMARFHLVLTVKQNSPFTSAQAMVDAAKAKPGEIDYGSPGVGSPHHLTMERLAKEAGVRFSHVPYRGAAPALNDLLAGTLEAMVLDLPSGLEYLRSGRVKPLAICSATRHPGLPEVPTIQEALGIGRFEAYAWQGMVVPARTPAAIADRLTAELARALQDSAVTDKMRGIGLEPLTGGPDEFKTLIEAERAVWVPLIKERGIVLD